MDMIELRRRVMLSMASGKLPTKIFTVENTYSNCQELLDDIKTSCGTERFIAVSQRAIDTFEHNGIYLISNLQNKSPVPASAAVRFRANIWGNIGTTSYYDASVPIGDKYTVYILDGIDM